MRTKNRFMTSVFLAIALLFTGDVFAEHSDFNISINVRPTYNYGYGGYGYGGYGYQYPGYYPGWRFAGWWNGGWFPGAGAFRRSARLGFRARRAAYFGFYGRAARLQAASNRQFAVGVRRFNRAFAL